MLFTEFRTGVQRMLEEWQQQLPEGCAPVLRALGRTAAGSMPHPTFYGPNGETYFGSGVFLAVLSSGEQDKDVAAQEHHVVYGPSDSRRDEGALSLQVIDGLRAQRASHYPAVLRLGFTIPGAVVAAECSVAYAEANASALMVNGYPVYSAEMCEEREAREQAQA